MRVRTLALILTLAVAAPAAADVAAPSQPEPYEVFTVGDSFAAGEGAPEINGNFDDAGEHPSPRETWDSRFGIGMLAGVDAQRCHRSSASTSGVATGLL